MFNVGDTVKIKPTFLGAGKTSKVLEINHPYHKCKLEDNLDSTGYPYWPIEALELVKLADKITLAEFLAE